MGFDLKTIAFLFFYTNLIGSGALAFVCFNVRKRVKGTEFWLTGMMIQTCGFLFLYLREQLLFSPFTVIAISLILLGNAVFIEGFIRFVDKKFFRFYNYLLLIPIVAILYYFTFVQDLQVVRDILFSSVTAIYTIQGGALFLVDTNTRRSQSARVAGWVLLLGFAISVGRVFTILTFFLMEGGNAFVQSFAALNQIVYYGLVVALLLSIILMVNRRLLDDAKMQEKKFSTIFHSSPDAVLLTKSIDGTIYDMNEAFSKITGYPHDELLGQSTHSIHLWVSEEDRRLSIEKVNSGKVFRNIEVPMQKKSGEIFTALLSLEPIVIMEEKCLLATFNDISELTRIRAELEQRATHDSLTGLPNRDLFYSHFRICKAFADRYKKNFSILSIDIDHFKYINDTFGHDYGDLVLVEAARKMCSMLRRGDIVSRFGGDEFVVLLSEIANEDGARITAAKLLDSFHDPLFIEEADHLLTLSIGIAVYPRDGTDMHELLKNADISLYKAKGNGRNRYELYDDFSKPEPECSISQEMTTETVVF